MNPQLVTYQTPRTVPLNSFAAIRRTVRVRTPLVGRIGSGVRVQSINQKVNLYSASSIKKKSQTRHLHISTLKQPCLKSTLELFPGNVTAS